MNVSTLAWPIDHVGSAFETLARRARLVSQPETTDLPIFSASETTADTITRWLMLAAAKLEIEAEPVETTYAEVNEMITQLGPALLLLPNALDNEAGGQILLVLRSSPRQITLIGPDEARHQVKPDVIRTALCSDFETPWKKRLASVLVEAGVTTEDQPQTLSAILQEQLSQARLQGVWLLRPRPGASFWQQVRPARLIAPFVVVTGLLLLLRALELGRWWLIGAGVLKGHFDPALMWGWALLLLTIVPLELFMAYAQQAFSIGVGSVFRQRLMAGILRLLPEEIRHQGVGQFLSMVMEADAFEKLALNGGYGLLIAILELISAISVLALGGGGWPHAGVLLAWSVLTIGLTYLYVRRNLAWSKSYQAMTNDLAERMVGHRTRLAQENRATWHQEEDDLLLTYLRLSERVDGMALTVKALLIRGWLFVGTLGLLQAFIMQATNIGQIAVSLGGILLASQALSRLVVGIQSLGDLAIAWTQAAPLYQAAARPVEKSHLTDAELRPLAQQTTTGNVSSDREIVTESETRSPAILTGRDLVFRYRERGRPILQNCDVQIRAGQRILLEGPSGGGKSTLVSLLAGLRPPETGLLLLQGFDRQTIGADLWRQRVVLVPQFHENHVFSETLAFNLLMGRRWPPEREDLREAELICHELGLGSLLDRMPGGLMQMVGESGWRLSHGERSRIYIARALLQEADLIILDESFGALDPESLFQAMACVHRRVKTLVVIAHP